MNSIESNFVTYQIALDMKSIGFDEPCMCFQYDKDSIARFVNMSDPQFKNLLTYTIILNNPTLNWNDKEVLKPTFSQSFRWFREKYNLQCSINFYSESSGIKKVPNHYEIQIDYLSNNKWCYFENINNKIYLTYEEAELECLKKLIEIVKENK